MQLIYQTQSVTTVRGNLTPAMISLLKWFIMVEDLANIYGDTLYGDGSNLTNLPTQVSIDCK